MGISVLLPRAARLPLVRLLTIGTSQLPPLDRHLPPDGVRGEKPLHNTPDNLPALEVGHAPHRAFFADEIGGREWMQHADQSQIRQTVVLVHN